MTLRLLTYLAPSIPEGLFALVARTIEEATGRQTRLELETAVSGPSPETDPFGSGRADLAFVCGPSYPLLASSGSPVELLLAAPVFDDPRAGGRPVYFADLIVAADSPATRFEDLCGSTFAFNDRSSLSGWFKMLARLEGLGHSGGPEAFFSGLLPSGTHLRSIELVAAGAADTATVDSNALRLEQKRDPILSDRIRVLEAWGPSPIQPLLARSTLPAELKSKVLETLLGMHESPALRAELSRFGVVRFAPVERKTYEALSGMSS